MIKIVSKAIIAAILSLLITGVGQMYLGKIVRGLIWLIGGIIIGIALGLIGLPLVAAIIPILSCIDAYMLGKKKR